MLTFSEPSGLKPFVLMNRTQRNRFIFVLLTCISAWSAPADAQSQTVPWALTGAYPIGTKIFYLPDSSRPDPVTSKAPRELMVQLWYPAKPSGEALAPYVTKALADAMKQDQTEPNDVIDSWAALKTHAHLEAPIADRGPKFPLIFLSPGLGFSRALYTSWAEELASLGYVVVAVDHPYTGLTVLPDVKVLSAIANE